MSALRLGDGDVKLYSVWVDVYGYGRQLIQCIHASANLFRITSQKDSLAASESGDIAVFDGHTVVFRFEEEAYFYVVGPADENEVVILQILSCFHDTLSQLLRNNLERKVLCCMMCLPYEITRYMMHRW